MTGMGISGCEFMLQMQLSLRKLRMFRNHVLLFLHTGMWSAWTRTGKRTHTLLSCRLCVQVATPTAAAGLHHTSRSAGGTRASPLAGHARSTHVAPLPLGATQETGAAHRATYCACLSLLQATPEVLEGKAKAEAKVGMHA